MRWRQWQLSSSIRRSSRGGPSSHVPWVQQDGVSSESHHWFIVRCEVDRGHHHLHDIQRLPQGLRPAPGARVVAYSLSTLPLGYFPIWTSPLSRGILSPPDQPIHRQNWDLLPWVLQRDLRLIFKIYSLTSHINVRIGLLVFNTHRQTIL
jgi:hypothetical protein